MRQLLPAGGTGDIDVTDAYLAAARPTPPDRPWVTLGMIASVDGASAVDGRSGPLGGPADRAVLRAVRAIADVILVGAGTVRAEDYGPVRLTDEARRARMDHGRAGDPPRLVIVSGSLDLDPASRVFGDDGQRPLVLTGGTASADAVDRLSAVADVRRHGPAALDLGAALSALAADGVEVVVCEGGPTLNAALVDLGAVDELCLTISPAIVGGTSPRIVTDAGARHDTFTLASLLEADDQLFGRWVRADG